MRSTHAYIWTKWIMVKLYYFISGWFQKLSGVISSLKIRDIFSKQEREKVKINNRWPAATKLQFPTVMYSFSYKG